MNNSYDNFQVKEAYLPDHHFRTEIPNIIFDIGLDPYTISVYCHLKRIAGDGGACWRSAKNMAQLTGMSRRKFIECIDILKKPIDVLGCSLICIQNRIKEDGSQDSNLITINPIWHINGKIYRDKKQGGVVHTVHRGSAPGAQGVVHTVHRGSAPGAHKEEHTQEEHKEELSVTADVAAVLEEKEAKENSSSDDQVSLPNEVIILTTGNKRITVTQSDVYARIVREKIQCSTEAIRYAWKTLCDYKGIVHDWWRFIEGTIEKYNNSQRHKNITQSKRTSCRTKQEHNSIKETLSEKNTSEQPLPKLVSLVETMKRLQNGSQNQSDS